ncbi:MAG: hypothetical protein GX558_03150 [Clostridiales bacterium]|nr:hypothetical protein [Clostridiales bacterium]
MDRHDHDPHDGCGCGHHHGRDHRDGCGCGHHHEHGEDCGCAPDYENGLSIAENNVLMALLERRHLPVARFALTSSGQKDAYAVAMEPVYIADPDDSLDQIREYGALFNGMEDKGLIELNYDRPLADYPYAEYRASAALSRFVATAAEARERGFTFDTPDMELGMISLTDRGRQVIDKMLS